VPPASVRYLLNVTPVSINRREAMLRDAVPWFLGLRENGDGNFPMMLPRLYVSYCTMRHDFSSVIAQSLKNHTTDILLCNTVQPRDKYFQKALFPIQFQSVYCVGLPFRRTRVHIYISYAIHVRCWQCHSRPMASWWHQDLMMTLQSGSGMRQRVQRGVRLGS
jgi:hypothetical protein